MPSRIDIGPEGGPFVAVNENNNDLELQDINGNVIAKWDETAGHWDFANTSLTNLAAVETDSLENGVAGAGNAIKSISGTTGQYRPLWTLTWVDEFSTTSSEFENVIPGRQRTVLPTFDGLTNASLNIQITGRFTTVDGSEAGAEAVYDGSIISGTDVIVTSTGSFESDIIEVPALSSPGECHIRLRSADNETATFQRLCLSIYERIGE